MQRNFSLHCILFLNDWDKQFSRNITPHYNYISIIEFSCIDKLAKCTF